MFFQRHPSIIKSQKDWDLAQIKFLETHKYHTDFAIRNRQPKKTKRIAELKNLIS